MRSSAPWRSAGLGPAWGLGFLDRMFAVLPLRVAYLLVLGLAPIYFMHHNRARYSVVRAMRRMGIGLAWWRALGAYVQYTLTLVDRHYAVAGRLQPVIDRAGSEEVLERLDARLASARPLILLGHHCGVLEMAVPALEAQGRVVRAVAVQDPEARRLLDNVGDSARSVGGARRAIVADGTMAAGLRMLSALRGGDVLAFKADRVPPGSDAIETVTVFGERVDLPRGPHDIARLAKADVEVLSVFRVGAGRYRILADPIPANATTPERAQAFGRILASHVRQQPNQWFNFFPWWRADARELASVPRIVPPGMRAATAGLAGALTSLVAAALVVVLSGGDVGGTLPLTLGWGIGGGGALWIAVGFLGGGVDRRGRPDSLANTALQASWAWPMATFLAGVGFDGWGSGLRLAVAAAIGLIAASRASQAALRVQDEDAPTSGAGPRRPAAPASGGRAPSAAGTAPPGPPPASAPAP
jgi:lauroyl/myristoyl acyltransferase